MPTICASNSAHSIHKSIKWEKNNAICDPWPGPDSGCSGAKSVNTLCKARAACFSANQCYQLTAVTVNFFGGSHSGAGRPGEVHCH